MKTLDKNQNSMNAVAKISQVLTMQQVLAEACLKQSLKLRSTVGQDPNGEKPYLQYEIMFNTNEPVVFTGQAYSPFDDHYQMMLSLVAGNMVSELFPPTLRVAGPNNETISYWKRRLVIEHDITMRHDDPNVSKADDLTKVNRQLVWIAYNTNGVELSRVTDGAANGDANTVERVQYLTLGPRGACVVVIFKDTKAAGLGNVTSLAEGLKGASEMAGLGSAGSSTSGGISLMAPMAVTLSSSPTGASTGAVTPISSLDLSAMRAPTDTALSEAIERLQKGRKEQKPTIELPETIRLDQLIRTLGDIASTVVDAAKALGIKHSILARLTQDEAAAICHKLGYPVSGRRAGTGPAAKKTTQKLPVAVQKEIKKNVARKTATKKPVIPANSPIVPKKPATKRVTRKKTPSND